MKTVRLAGIASSVSLAVYGLTQRALAACSITDGVAGGAECAKGASSPTDLTTQIGKVTDTLIFVVGAASIIMVVIGGMRYVLSGGDQKGTENAKNTILYAVIGLVISLLAYSIVHYVVNAF